MDNKKVKIYTLGCKVNQYDSSFLLSKLELLNFKKVKQNADLAIINSCAVTHTAIRKNRQMISKARKENPRAKIVLMGCWVEAYGDEIKKDKIDLIWGVGKIEKLVKEIQKQFYADESADIKELPFKNIVSTDKTRYFLKIQDGCEQFCSYCIIPFTRGKLKSRNEKEIIKEASNAIQKGFKEIILNGIHIGLYGREKNSNAQKNLNELITEILKIKDLKRLRLSSIEITEVSDELAFLIKNNKNFCPHLHISLQSGSDKILKLMNRPYDSQYFFQRIKKIRKIIPDIAISTDIIVGFPGENEKDFQDTLNFVEKIKFSKIHVFPYSPHEKTKAFNFPGHLSREEILNRSRVLRKIALEQENDFKKQFLNQEIEVLVEKSNPNGKIMGRSEYYFEVLFSKKDILDKNCNVDKISNKMLKIKYRS